MAADAIGFAGSRDENQTHFPPTNVGELAPGATPRQRLTRFEETPTLTGHMAKGSFTPRLLAGFLPLLLLTVTVNARLIESNESAIFTGKLSLAKDGGIQVSSSDIVEYNYAKFPVKNVPVSAKSNRDDAVLKELAVQGKTVKMHGEFHRLHARQLDAFHADIILNEAEVLK